MVVEKEQKKEQRQTASRLPVFPQKFISSLAEEVAKRLPAVISSRKRKKKAQKNKKIERAFFLDTSAIIDGRIFDVVALGFLINTFVILEQILLELKHIADSQDLVKKERGRKGLEFLEQLKKNRSQKMIILAEDKQSKKKTVKREVDEVLIQEAKANKGRIITCDYNLEKKASIQGIKVVNVNALAQSLKVRAVPGESLVVKVLHVGKDTAQGVGYLDDGTMIVVEEGSEHLGKEVNVVVARVIQTAAGRILFAKKI